MKRRLLTATAAVAALTLILTAASLFGGVGATTQKAKAASPTSNLFAYVVPTTRGPLPACSGGSDCTATNTVWHFIYVANANPLTTLTTLPFAKTNRTSVPNAFVVTSVDSKVFVNGAVLVEALTYTPPPNAFYRGASGHWPSTVTCPPDGTSPCNVVGSPAVVPNENVAILYTLWIHVDNEPNGTHVFKFTIHGTLNGNPVDLTASSPPIKMTN